VAGSFAARPKGSSAAAATTTPATVKPAAIGYDPGVTPISQWLEEAGAQHDVVQWAEPYAADMQALWERCPRGDWMLAIAARLGARGPRLVQAAIGCARLALAYVPDDDPRAAGALDGTQKYCEGANSLDACRIYRQLLHVAVDTAEDPAAAAAFSAAVAAIDAIDDPEAAVSAAVFAAQAAVLSAGDCAMAEALRFVHEKSARQVRQYLPATTLTALYSAAVD